MVDYFKVRLLNKQLMEKNFENKEKDFKVQSKYNYTLGIREAYPLNSRKENLYIKVTRCYGSVENSIHKYYNSKMGNGNHNFNDFNFCDIQFTLDEIEREISYPLSETLITNLEFGFNIELNITPAEFLERFVLMHNFKEPCYAPKNDEGKKIKKFQYKEYEIKIYDKSLNFARQKEFEMELKDKNILRVEVKYTSKKQLQKMGIFNLEDLRDPNVYLALMKDFLNKFDKFQIIDSYCGEVWMNKKEVRQITNYTHPSYWVSLKGSKSKNTSCYHKKQYDKIVEKYNLDTWKSELREDIIEKFNLLMNSDCNRSSVSLFNVA